MNKKDIINSKKFFKNESIKDFFKFSEDCQNQIISTKLLGLSSELDFWLKIAYDNDFSKIKVLTDNYDFKIALSFPKKYHKFDKDGKCISE